MRALRETSTERKADTRKKIMLGGLIVKAELDYMHPDNPDILFGLLLHAKELVQQNPNIVAHWKKLGEMLMENKIQKL